jgi:hypothetical protein
MTRNSEAGKYYPIATSIIKSIIVRKTNKGLLTLQKQAIKFLKEKKKDQQEYTLRMTELFYNLILHK